MCGASVPDWLAHMFEGLDEDPETRRMVAAIVAAEQVRLLQANGDRRIPLLYAQPPRTDLRHRPHPRRAISGGLTVRTLARRAPARYIAIA